MIAVDRWTGEEALLLRSVRRQSVRAFAEDLGISPRTVSHWQENNARECRPSMAQILDAALAQCTPEEQEAFRVRLAALRGDSVSATGVEVAQPARAPLSRTNSCRCTWGNDSAPCTQPQHPGHPAQEALSSEFCPANIERRTPLRSTSSLVESHWCFSKSTSAWTPLQSWPCGATART